MRACGTPALRFGRSSASGNWAVATGRRLLHHLHDAGLGGAARRVEGLVVVHAPAAADGDALGGGPAHELGGAGDGEVGVGGVELADADVGAAPGGGGAGGQEVEDAVGRNVVVGGDGGAAGDVVAVLDVERHRA